MIKPSNHSAEPENPACIIFNTIFHIFGSILAPQSINLNYILLSIYEIDMKSNLTSIKNVASFIKTSLDGA